MKYIFFTCYFFFTASLLQVSAQSSCLVHLNQSFYVSGEVIWYKLYLPANFPTGPTVFTASIYDQSGTLVNQSYLQQKEPQTVYGYYKIPYTLPSDVYLLLFSATEEENNLPILLAEAMIPIYNDFEALNREVASKSIDKPNQSPKANQLNDLQVEISMNSDQYSPRSTAKLTVKIKDVNGQALPAQFSISVNDQYISEVDQPLFSTIQTGPPLKNLPTLEEDISLRGALFEPDGQSRLFSGNIGAYLINQKQFIYAKGDWEGHFMLDLPPVYADCPIHVGGLLPENLLVTLDQEVPHTSIRQSLPYPPEVIRYLELSRKRKTIYQLYGRLENTFTAEFPILETENKEPDLPLLLDEYNSFSDIPTFFKEMIVPLKFRSRKDGPFTARMFDPYQKPRSFYSRGPLFILDGKLTRDADYIAKLDIKKLERIDLFYTMEKARGLFGPLGRNGIVMIQSRIQDVEVPDVDQKNFFQIYGFQANVDYPAQIQDIANNEALLRPALYWTPNVTTNEQGEASVSIPLSDDYTRFRIEIVAQSQDGRRGQGWYVFEVRGED